MMKIDVIDSNELFQGVIKTEHFKVEGDNIERLWRLFCLYKSKRAAENYSRKSFEELIFENRFSYGALETTLNGEPICFCGLHNYHSWVIVTRMVTLKYFSAPFGSGHMLPFLLAQAQGQGLDGIVVTFNSYNRRILNTLVCPGREARYHSDPMHRSNVEHPIYREAIRIGKMFRQLEQTVRYRNTEQYVAYIPLKGKTPQFEAFNKRRGNVGAK